MYLITALAHICATIGFLGYLPARGTVVTACIGIPLMIYLHISQRWKKQSFMLLLFATVAALITTAYALPAFPGVHDPSAIVIDEIVGFMWTFWRRPITKRSLVIGFLAFRFFDITKWGLVGVSELLPGAFGIVMDDVIAGLFANLTLWSCL